MHVYACIYTEGFGKMHKKMVTARDPTRGCGWLGSMKELSFHNLNPFVPLKLCTIVTNLKAIFRASLVVQWLRICLPLQGTRVRALVQEDPTCHGATKPSRCNY